MAILAFDHLCIGIALVVNQVVTATSVANAKHPFALGREPGFVYATIGGTDEVCASQVHESGLVEPPPQSVRFVAAHCAMPDAALLRDPSPRPAAE